jgi:hypothetical protein
MGESSSFCIPTSMVRLSPVAKFAILISTSVIFWVLEMRRVKLLPRRALIMGIHTLRTAETDKVLVALFL